MSNKMIIKKALLEAKFMAKPEDMDKLMPKLKDDDIVKLVDEENIQEAPAQNDPKIEKYVNNLNQLIASAIDGDGNPIPVVDKSGTWEEPVVYQPIVYRNGSLGITYIGYDGEKHSDTVLKRNMEYDGIPQLKLINKLYNAAIKRASKAVPHVEESAVNEDGINTDKLRTDVAKLMDKLNLRQFQAIFDRIDKPQEQAEVIAAFAEIVGVPRQKLPSVIASIKSVAENTNPKMTKGRLEEFILHNKK